MSAKKPSLHKGHRERMRKRYRETGFSGFNEHQILEMALFYATPRCDTNELAHELLNVCGPRLCDVMDCSYSKLMTVKGVGSLIATFLSFIHDLSAYYYSSKQLCVNDYFVNEMESVCKFFEGRFMGVGSEQIRVAAVTPELRFIREQKLSDGTVGKVEFPRRKLMEFVCENNSDRVIIAHNHPHEPPVPSKEDYIVTKELVSDMRKFGVEIVDHIIVGEGGSMSIRSSYNFADIWDVQ